jgi:hypothetical protein
VTNNIIICSQEARKLFEESLPIMKKHMDNSKEYGMALLNYAESLANLKLLPQAEQTTKYVCIITTS